MNSPLNRPLLSPVILKRLDEVEQLPHRPFGKLSKVKDYVKSEIIFSSLRHKSSDYYRSKCEEQCVKRIAKIERRSYSTLRPASSAESNGSAPCTPTRSKKFVRFCSPPKQLTLSSDPRADVRTVDRPHPLVQLFDVHFLNRDKAALCTRVTSLGNIYVEVPDETEEPSWTSKAPISRAEPTGTYDWDTSSVYDDDDIPNFCATDAGESNEPAVFYQLHRSPVSFSRARIPCITKNTSDLQESGLGSLDEPVPFMPLTSTPETSYINVSFAEELDSMPSVDPPPKTSGISDISGFPSEPLGEYSEALVNFSVLSNLHWELLEPPELVSDCESLNGEPDCESPDQAPFCSDRVLADLSFYSAENGSQIQTTKENEPEIENTKKMNESVKNETNDNNESGSEKNENNENNLREGTKTGTFPAPPAQLVPYSANHNTFFKLLESSTSHARLMPLNSLSLLVMVKTHPVTRGEFHQGRTLSFCELRPLYPFPRKIESVCHAPLQLNYWDTVLVFQQSFPSWGELGLFFAIMQYQEDKVVPPSSRPLALEYPTPNTRDTNLPKTCVFTFTPKPKLFRPPKTGGVSWRRTLCIIAFFLLLFASEDTLPEKSAPETLLLGAPIPVETVPTDTWTSRLAAFQSLKGSLVCSKNSLCLLLSASNRTFPYKYHPFKLSGGCFRHEEPTGVSLIMKHLVDRGYSIARASTQAVLHMILMALTALVYKNS